MAGLSKRAPLAWVAAGLLATVAHAALLTWQYARTDVSNLNTPSANTIRFFLFALYGAPIAAAATALLGVPAYWLVKRTIGITGGSSVLAGAVVGLAVSLIFSTFAAAALIASPLVGFGIGAMSSAAWWLLAANRPFVFLTRVC